MSYQITTYKGVMVVKQHKLDEPKREKVKVEKRGCVRGMSRKSRKNLLRLCNQLQPSENYYFVTLTYQLWEDDNFKLWKRQLDRVFQGLRYHFPESSGVWRLEFQKRKAPHYHILFHIPENPSCQKLKTILRKYWLSALGQDSKAITRYGVKVDQVGNDYKNCALYSAIYSAKDANDRIDIKTGRPWGKYNQTKLPVHAFQAYEMSRVRQTILRRICRKWLQAHQRDHGYARYLSSPQGSFDIFIPHHVQIRLLDFVKNFETARSSENGFRLPVRKVA
jgi:hypothetical protein